MEFDPVWLKPKEERPKKRSVFGALRKETNLKCLILTSLICGCVLAIVWCRVTRVTKIDIDFNAFPITRARQISPCDDGYIYIPSAFVVMLYLLYLIECWHCKAWVQLRYEKTDVKRAYQIIDEMKSTQPLVWWKAVCYHYVRRTREIARIHNGDSYPATQVYYERVNSNLAAGCFYFGYCGMKDISGKLLGLEKHTATKIRFSKGFLFANLAAAQEFEEQRSTFFQDQERYDDYMEMKEGLDLSPSGIGSYGDFKENLISWNSPDNLPWFARSSVFWAANFLLLSWPFRFILELNTAHVHYHVTKLFGSNYLTPRSPQNGLISSPGAYTRTAGGGAGRRSRSTQIRAVINRNRNQSTRTPSNTSPRTGTATSTDLESQPLLLSRGDFLMEPVEKAEVVKKVVDHQQQQHENVPYGSNDLLLSNNFSPLRNSDFERRNRHPLQFFRRLNPPWRLRTRRGENRLPRSVTLLMTKGERKEFGVYFHGGGYFDNFHIVEDDSNTNSTSTTTTHGANAKHSKNSSILASVEGTLEGNSSSSSNRSLLNVPAPTYSQALLWMDPRSQPEEELFHDSFISTPNSQQTIPNISSSSSTDLHNSSSCSSSFRNTSNSSRITINLRDRSSNEENPNADDDDGGNLCGLEDPMMETWRNRVPVVGNSTTGNQSWNLMMMTEEDERPGDNENRGCGGNGNRAHDFSSSSASRSDYTASTIPTTAINDGRNLSSTATSTVIANSISRSSSLALNTIAPRTTPGVAIDLTQPIVLTVPNDPRRTRMRNLLQQDDDDDNPPSYEEALRTSRPVFLPTLARIRRCFTERDLHSRLSSSLSNLWFNYDEDEGGDVVVVGVNHQSGSSSRSSDAAGGDNKDPHGQSTSQV